MNDNDDFDREREWLLRQRDNGLTHDEIAALIGVSRSTITKNLITIDEGGDMAMPLRRKIAAYLDRQEQEAQRRRQAEIDEAAEKERAREAARRLREEKRIRNEKRDAAKRKIGGLKKGLKNLEATRLRALREVNERLEAEGIDTGGRTHGDGVIYARTLEGFHYADPDAEKVGFAPDSYRFRGDWTGEELREGISARQRQKSSLIPEGAERPEFIGVRPGAVVTVASYPDDRVFWGEHASTVNDWRRLFRSRPSWWEGGKVPRLPGEADVAWYREALEIEKELLSRGLRFEQSIIDWGDDWRDSVGDACALLDSLERGGKQRTTLEKVTYTVFALRWVILSVAVLTFTIVFWNAFVGDALRWLGDSLLSALMVILTPFILLLKGLWWVVTGIAGVAVTVFRALVTAYHKIVWFVTSPWLMIVTGGCFLLCLPFLKAKPSGRKAILIFLGISLVTILSGFATFFLLFYWKVYPVFERSLGVL